MAKIKPTRKDGATPQPKKAAAGAGKRVGKSRPEKSNNQLNRRVK